MNWDTEELIDILSNDETMYWLAIDIVRGHPDPKAELQWVARHRIDAPIDLEEVDWDAVIAHFTEEEE